MDSTKKYTVLEPVTVGDNEHEAGAVIELTEEQAGALPKGSIEEVKDEEAK